MHLATALVKNSLEHNLLANLLRMGQVVLPDASRRADAGPELAAALNSQVDLEPLGFVYSRELILALSWLSRDEIACAHENLVFMLTRHLGAQHVFKPMYPNFPRQVLQADELELLVNAFLHYTGDWLGLRILPRYTESRRALLVEPPHGLPKVCLTLAPPDAPKAHLLRLLEGNASLSLANRQLLLEGIEHYAQQDQVSLITLLWSATVPQKENRALAGGYLLQRHPDIFAAADLKRFFTTSTDVLRLAVAVGADPLGADLSLSAPPRFSKLGRGLRRSLLGLLEGMSQVLALPELFQRRGMWLRLGEQLHPGEHQKQFPRAHALFYALRKNQHPASWAGAVESVLAPQSVRAPISFSAARSAINLLQQRPGVFARKLHEVLRKVPADQGAAVVADFGAVAEKVSTPVLLQLRHRMQRDVLPATTDVAAYQPKAGSGRVWVPPVALARVLPELALRVVDVVDVVLLKRFSALPALGKVFIDPALRGFSVPFGQRTAQKAVQTVGRGSRLPVGEGNILRAFLWWSESGVDKQGRRLAVDRVDLDLSCAVLDTAYQPIGQCSYTNLRTPGLTHSGDVTSAPKGACEFIDIDFSRLPENAAYIALVTYAYTRQNFADMPEAYLGWMVREEGQSGKIFDARTVRQKVDLTTNGARLLVGILDVARREFVWADLVMPAKCHGANAIQTSTEMLQVLAPGVLQSVRPTLYDLAVLHGLSRGTPVAQAADADFLFLAGAAPKEALRAGQQSITPFEAERIAAEFLA